MAWPVFLNYLKAFPSCHILLVEDSLGYQQIIREAFNECGHSCVVTFANTLEGARAKLNRSAFTMIIVDVQLGWQNGLELVKEIRSEPSWAAMPVVALSGINDHMQGAYEAGVNCFLSKPFEYPETVRMVRSLMNFWGLVVELPEASCPLPPSILATRQFRPINNSRRVHRVAHGLLLGSPFLNSLSLISKINFEKGPHYGPVRLNYEKLRPAAIVTHVVRRKPLDFA